MTSHTLSLSPPAPSGAAQRALAAVARYQDAPHDGTAEVRAAISAYVSELRARGIPSESAVVATKLLVAHAGTTLYRSEGHEVFAEQAARWCIEEYYRGR